jgi:hypothetical protein
MNVSKVNSGVVTAATSHKACVVASFPSGFVPLIIGSFVRFSASIGLGWVGSGTKLISRCVVM